jgi:pimeloyl-ACP methyl ester carboxylesterase
MAASAVGGDPPGWFGRILAGTLISDGHRPVDAIARIDRPILILHGSVDSIIPTSHGQALAAAAPQATLVILPGGDHNTLRSTHPQVETMVVEFLDEHLAPAAGPGPAIPAAGAEG